MLRLLVVKKVSVEFVRRLLCRIEANINRDVHFQISLKEIWIKTIIHLCVVKGPEPRYARGTPVTLKLLIVDILASPFIYTVLASKRQHKRGPIPVAMPCQSQEREYTNSTHVSCT